MNIFFLCKKTINLTKKIKILTIKEITEIYYFSNSPKIKKINALIIKSN